MTVAGAIVAYGGSSAPTDWLLCDGTAVSRSTYSALFAAVGETFGVGDGSTTFNLPNLQERIPLGASTYAPGTTGGALGHTHTTAAHSHSFTQPSAHGSHTVGQPSAHNSHTIGQPTAHTAHSAFGAHAHDDHPGGSTMNSGSPERIGLLTHASNGGHQHDDGIHAHTGWDLDAHTAHSGLTVDAHSAHSGGAVTSGGAGTTGAATDPPYTVLNFIIRTVDE